MKFVICGNYGAGNIGDEMILEGMIALLREADQQAEITVFSANPEETKEKHQVDSVKKFPAGVRSFFNYLQKGKTTKNALKSADFFILGGGALFNGPKFKANIIWGIQGLIAKFYKKRIIVLGQSIAKNDSWIIEQIVTKIFENAELITVRDQESVKTLSRWGINKAHYYPDLAFNIKSPKISKRGKELIVSLRQKDSLPSKFKLHIAKFINWLIKEKDWRIKFIDFQKGEAEDNRLHKDVIELINNRDSIQHLTKIKSSQELMNHYKNAKMVLGMRLHSIITSIITSTPFLGISYHPKIKNLAESLNLEDYILDLENITTEKLRNTFKMVDGNYQEIEKQMNRKRKKALQNNAEQAALLKKTISSATQVD